VWPRLWDFIRGRHFVEPLSLTRLLWALAATGLTTVAAVLLHRTTRESTYLFLYIVPIAATGYFEGMTAGTMAAVLSTIAVWYFLLTPEFSFRLGGHALIVLALFAATAVSAATGGGRLRRYETARRLLGEVSEVLEEPLDLQARLARIASITVPRFADWCVVDLADEDRRIRTVVVAHKDPSKGEWARRFQERYPSQLRASTGASTVIRTGRAELHPTIPDTLLTQNAPDESYVQIVREIGPKSAMVVPLIGRDRTLGAITLVSTEPNRHYSQGDLALAEEIGRRAGLAVENAQLHQAALMAREHAERTAERTVRLQAVTAALSEALTREQVADVILTQGGKALGALAGAVYSVSRDGTRLDMLGSAGYPPEIVTKRAQLPLSSRAPAAESARRRASIYLQSRDEVCRRYPDVRDTVHSYEGARAFVPLLVGGQPIGTLVFVFREPKEFPAEDRSFIDVLADQCAQALERARLYDAERATRASAERVADRIARLQEITAALSEALTPEQVAQVVVDQGVRALGAQAGSLSLLGEDGTMLEVVRSIGYPENLIQKWRRYAVSTRMAITDAMKSGQLVCHESGMDFAARYPYGGEVPEALRDGARVAMPLMLGARCIGALYMNFENRRQFGPDDQEFMTALGRQCAQAIERAQLYARERRVAVTLQRALLPTGLPQVPGSTIHATYVPGASESEVGGDWYDVFRLADGRVALGIGDVAGRGLQAAVIMGQLRQSIRVAALEGHAPAAVLDRANKTLRFADEHATMATAVFGIFDPVSSTFSYSTAGHPPPMRAGPQGTVETLATGGLPLGVLDAGTLPTWTVHLAPGTLLALYTDGLVESRRNPEAGEAALMSALGSEAQRRSADPARAILAGMLPGDRAPDDIALVTLALDPAPVDRLDLTLPAEPASLRLVRQGLQQLGRVIGLNDDRVLALSVAAGEAVNNAIEHAYGVMEGTVRVRAHQDGSALIVEIQDQGTWRPERPRTEGGRGLEMMRALVDTVDVDTAPSGTTVRLAVNLGDLGTAHTGTVPHTPPRTEGALAAAPGAAGFSPPGWAALQDHPPHEIGRVEMRLVGDIPVVEIGGEVDLTNSQNLTAALTHAASSSSGPVIVSLARASYFDSQAINSLLLFGRRMATNRRSLLIVPPQIPALRRTFDVAGLGAVFSIFDSVDGAVAAAQSARSAPSA
jgi:anti-anti-sigma factor